MNCSPARTDKTLHAPLHPPKGGRVISARALSVANLCKILSSRLVGSCLRLPLMAMHLHYIGHHEAKQQVHIHIGAVTIGEQAS